VDEAETRAKEIVVLAREIGDRSRQVWGLALLARVALERGQEARAATLWAAVESAGTTGTIGRWKQLEEAFEAQMRGLRLSASPLSLEDAVAYALSSEQA